MCVWRVTQEKHCIYGEGPLNTTFIKLTHSNYNILIILTNSTQARNATGLVIIQDAALHRSSWQHSTLQFLPIFWQCLFVQASAVAQNLEKT